MKIKYHLFALLIVFCGCSYFGPPEYPDYDIPKIPNHSDKLRLDGYYYYYNSDSSCINVNVLYRNGVGLFLGMGDNFAFFEKQVFNNFYRENIAWWGLYLIEQDTIIYNNIYMDIDRVYKTELTKGMILNDTTIIYRYMARQSNGSIMERKEVLHFKQYSPKPDSTNIFTNR